MSQSTLTRNQWIVGLLVLLLILALHGWSLMRFPAPFADEAWLTSRAWDFIRTGRAFGPLDSGLVDRLDGYWTINQWLMTFLDSLSLRFFSTPQLLATRIVSLVFGVLLLGMVYLIAWRLGGQRLGLLSVILVSLSWPFLYSAHQARYDIVTAALGFAAIALYLLNHTSGWVGLLSGFCVGLAFEIHPNGMIYAPAVLALYGWESRWKMLREGWFWGFILGGLAGLFLYAALHILPYPQTYFTLNRLAFGDTRTPPLVTFDPLVMLQAVAEAGRSLYTVYQLAVILMLWAALILIRRRSKADQAVLILGAALLLAYALLIRNKFYYYAILVSPALDMLLAAFLLDFVRRPWRGHLWDYLSRVAVWGLLVGSIALTWSVLRMDLGGAFRQTQDRVNSVVRPGETVMGSQIYWFGLHDHAYYSWELLVLYPHFVAGATLEDAFREFRPDVFVVDGHVNEFIGDPDQPVEPYRRYLMLSSRELGQFLDRQAELSGVFDTDYFGQVRVYRLRW